MPRKRYNYQFKDKQVNFLDNRHGFWRLGECYKEDGKWLSVRDRTGSRYRIPNNPQNVELFMDIKASGIK